MEEQSNLFIDKEMIDEFIKSFEYKEKEREFKEREFAIESRKKLHYETYVLLRPILFAIIVGILIVSFFLLMNAIKVKLG